MLVSQSASQLLASVTFVQKMWPFQSNNKDKIRDQSDTLEKMSIDINEEELGDPALLAELAGLAINDGNNPDFHGLKNMVDVEGILANIPMDDPDINDVDENDPVLLAELRGLISSDVKNDEQMASVPIPISSKELHGTEVGDDSKNGNPTVEDLAFMLKCSQAEKQLALTKKKTGDTQGALLHLRKSKLLDNRIKELRASKVEQVSEDTILYENSKESNYTTKLPVSEEELSLQNAVSEKLLFSTRHIEYRKAALALKRQNRKEEAQKMLRVSKQIESVLDSITAGNPVTDFVLPGPPVISEGATPGGIKHHDSADIDELIAKLDDQSSHCSELALNFHKAKDKTNAALFLKYRKQMLQDKDTLIRMKEGKQSISYHSEMKEYNYAITMMNNDIPSNTLNIQILRANLVELKTGSWNSSVSYDFGWPSVIESKGETKNVLGPKPGIKY